MPIKIKLGQLVSAVEAKAIEHFEACEPPWCHRFACAKLCAAVLEEYRRYSVLRDELVRKYGIEDKEKHLITVSHPDNTPEKMQTFHDGLNALLGTEIDLAGEPLSAAQLGEKCTLTIGDIRALGPLLVE
jgi:hypothetical protein